jgi:hypothetical protein
LTGLEQTSLVLAKSSNWCWTFRLVTGHLKIIGRIVKNVTALKLSTLMWRKAMSANVSISTLWLGAGHFRSAALHCNNCHMPLFRLEGRLACQQTSRYSDCNDVRCLLRLPRKR